MQWHIKSSGLRWHYFRQFIYAEGICHIKEKNPERRLVKAAQRLSFYLSTQGGVFSDTFTQATRSLANIFIILWSGTGWTQAMSWIYGWMVMPTICLLRFYFLGYLGVKALAFAVTVTYQLWSKIVGVRRLFPFWMSSKCCILLLNG